MLTYKKTMHPGSYVREKIIPTGMSVKEAANHLGIGRPALSNFLNGKAALSVEMAARLEKVFGANQQQLLIMQSEYDMQERRKDLNAVSIKAFVPNFLTIKARQIVGWAENHIEARTHLPVLLRKLVNSTGDNLLKVDFPGYDNAQRKGSDGFVESGAATPWIPAGRSYWEFGTEKNPTKKADKDYSDRCISVDEIERKKSTFVFVTPRNWGGKTAWERTKNGAGDWKNVRVFDASDLEQWLEQSIPTQIWFNEQINQPLSGYETLEQVWKRWSNASDPHITSEIFMPSISTYRDSFKSWLDNTSVKPFVVAADSCDEALAFLSCIFNDEALLKYKDISAVFTSPEALRKLIASFVPFIPIVCSNQTERELIDVYNRLHCIVFRPRNTVDREADVTLDLLGYGAFEKALIAMGIERSDIDRLARESGYSPTILRRRLSKNTAIRSPEWASDKEIAKNLVPIAMIGAWHSESTADREIVSFMADLKYEKIESHIAHLLQFDDSPVWSVGSYCGVASKIDALFAVSTAITLTELDRFFIIAEYVLSETDPALDLPEKDRWAAVLYGKTRDHSGALRDGICETLVILSVHGNNLFQSRLGIDVEARITYLIHKLLTPLTFEKVSSQNGNLPRYAEAAPDEFLRIIEEDMSSANPVVFSLLKPVERDSIWGSPLRTGLLWALECLAWKSKNLPRVASILAQLSKQKIDDNWINKPEHSLQSIFRSWLPQTSASLDERVKALNLIIKRYPEIGWKVCIEQIKPGLQSGEYNYRPRWRNDASGSGRGVNRQEMTGFLQIALDYLITWPSHNEKTLSDLIESFQSMSEEYQNKVWDLIDEWSQNADEVAKAVLRESIRQFALSCHGRKRNLGETTRDRGHESYERLKPDNPVIRHGWLFADHWVQESADEIEEEGFNYQKRDERIDGLRREAITEIWSACGFDGITAFLNDSGAAGTIGLYVAYCVTGFRQRVDFIRSCISFQNEPQCQIERCLQGFLSGIENDTRSEIIQSVIDDLAAKDLVRLFICAPFRATTWRLLDHCNNEVRAEYWRKVFPSWDRHTPVELNELIDRLLEAQRPRAAFHVVRMDFKEIETSRLKRLLRGIATSNVEPANHFKLDRYHISQALNSLEGRASVSLEEMGQLEFLFIGALKNSKHGIPNLERQIAQHPILFVQAVALTCRRSDGSEDPPEWKIEDPKQKSVVASAAYDLLKQIKKIPGTNENGKIDVEKLMAWIAEVRRLCREYGRSEIGDQCLGQLLAKAPEGVDGMWPCKEVCEAMERIASPEIGKGFHISVKNSRGVHWRGKGGAQERELAAKYRSWAEHLNFYYPYVGKVLESIAAAYDHEAAWEDSRTSIDKRLDY